MVTLVVSAFTAAGVVAVGLDDDSGPPPVLESYPGFGKSEDFALRDDTIALWETFEREEAVSDCMVAAGFEYSPDVAYPDDRMAAIARSLQIVRAEEPAADPSALNDAVRAKLDADRLDQYFLALHGKTEAALTVDDQSGGESKDELAPGGCVDAAAEEVGSIWTLRRQLEPQLAELADAAAADGSEMVDLDAAFVAENRGIFDAQAARYASATDSIAANQAFRSYLSVALAYL